MKRSLILYDKLEKYREIIIKLYLFDSTLCVLVKNTRSVSVVSGVLQETTDALTDITANS